MRKIIHIDMDCFYAAVEMRDNPEYQYIPLAVGGTGTRSVLCTCNYIARKYGVRSAMPVLQAKKLCPDLLIVNGRMEVYKQVSQQIRHIFSRYTNIIEPLSLDEAFLDVSNTSECNGSATLLAQRIRADIFQQTGLTASAGIAPNKFLAKIASDENKPNGQYVITPAQVSRFVDKLPLAKISGIGPKTAQKLAKQGFYTCADIRQSNVKVLQAIVGKFASALYQRSFGIDDRALIVNRIRKSLAVEKTLSEDISDHTTCFSVLSQLYIKLQARLAALQHKKIIKQGIKLKFADFKQTTVEQQSHYCHDEVFAELLHRALARSNGRAIRLIGLTLGFKNDRCSTTDIDKTTKQLSLDL